MAEKDTTKIRPEDEQLERTPDETPDTGTPDPSSPDEVIRRAREGDYAKPAEDDDRTPAADRDEDDDNAS